MCKPHVQGVCLEQGIQREHSIYEPEHLTVVAIQSQLSLIKTGYVSGTELGMVQPFISNLQNRLCKEGVSPFYRRGNRDVER